MNAKLSQHRVWHSHENRLIMTIQTKPHNLYVSFKSASLYWELGLTRIIPKSTVKGSQWQSLAFIIDWRVVLDSIENERLWTMIGQKKQKKSREPYCDIIFSCGRRLIHEQENTSLACLLHVSLFMQIAYMRLFIIYGPILRFHANDRSSLWLEYSHDQIELIWQGPIICPKLPYTLSPK